MKARKTPEFSACLLSRVFIRTKTSQGVPMKWRTTSSLAVAVTLMVVTFSPTARAASLDQQKIEQITGAKATFNKDENVIKVSFPRDDVKVTIDGSAMPPFMGLTSWAAFMPAM